MCLFPSVYLFQLRFMTNNPAYAKIKILVVDDQKLVRQGLATLLSLEDDFEIVGEAGDGTEALLLVEKFVPNVVLMDLHMPVCDGVTATGRILARFSSVKILALTTFDDEDLILDAVHAGVAGYLLKDTPRDQLAAAVRAVHQGNLYMGPTIAPKVMSHVSRTSSKLCSSVLARLTSRELEVLRLIGQGKSNKEIGEHLSITEGTVKNHVTRVLTAIGARDRTQAALWAQENI
jgi:DNA-binding NarL/FixJ family response regulator